VSAGRGWVERLSGGRTASTTEPSASRPEPGPDRPVRSDGPERTPLPGPGPRARPPVPDPEGPTLRVVLVSRDNMLAGVLRSLIETPGGVRVLDWYSEELDSAIRHADVVIVDMPPNLHERTFAVIDGRFLGRTVVLLQEGEHAEALPAGPSRAVLYRPLQIGELWTAITGAATPAPAEPPQEAEAGSPAPEPATGGSEVDAAVGAAPAPEAADDHAAPGEAEEAAAAAAAASAAGQGLPVAESGRLIGLSGRELDPVIGPGQVAPGMDEATFERLRRWGRQAPGKAGQPADKRRTTAGRAEARRAKEAKAKAQRAEARRARKARAEAQRAEARRAKEAKAEARRADRAAAGRAKAAGAEARREQTRQERAARQEARQEARAEVDRVRAARAESRTTAREASRQAKAAKAEARQVARAESRQARADARQAAQEQARQAKAARTEARAAAQEETRQAKAAQAEARAAAQEETRLAKAAEAEAQAAAREEARRVKAAQAEAQAAAREEARKADAAARAAAQEETRQAKAARAEARRVARAEARQARAASTEARREQSRQARAARAAARTAAREEAARVSAAQAEARQAARAEEDRKRAAEAEVRRAQVQQTEAEQAKAREAARAEAARKQAEQAEARTVARAEAAQRQAEQAEARKVARAEAAQRRAARAEARKVARAEAAQQRQVRAEARKAARAEAGQARAARAELRREARAEAAQQRRVQAEARRARSREAKTARARARENARAEAGRKRADRAEVRRVARAEAAERRAAQAEGRKVARAEAAERRAAQAAARSAARAEARQARAAGVAERRVARAEAREGKAALAEARRVARAEAWQERGDQARTLGVGAGVGLLALVVAVVGLVAAGWREGGGPESRAGEVAVVRAAGGSEGGLVVQDPRVGPIEPLYALGVGVVLRGAEAGTSLEGAIRDARVPSRYLLAGVVALTVLLFLLLMRVGPGTGAAAGPGPAPPQRQGRDRLWRLGGGALAGLLVALDPVLVRSGRAATGTVLAVLLALATLVLAWGVPARPTLRWLPLVAAGGGLALLVSPLALPVLAVPVVAELLEGRYQEAWRDMAALVLAVGLWLVLPVWVAGQELGAGQAGWLLGRPPRRGSVVASLADDRLTWLLVAGSLAAAILAWRHRSGARLDPEPDAPGDPPGPARVLAWTMTTAAGALGAVALGYPASQALPFAVPAAAGSLALAGGWVVARWIGGVRGTGGVVPRLVGLGVAVALAGLLVAQGVDWGTRYGGRADDGLGRLVATVGDQVPDCSAVNASGPDDRARLVAAGVTVTEFADGPAAHAAGVRYFVLTGGNAGGGPMSPSLAAWVRQHGTRMAAHPSRSLSGVELWRVDAAPLDPVADSLPVADGLFSNVDGSACGGFRVVDSQSGTFHTAYRAAGGKMVLGRPLGSVWTSDGPALQAFDTMVLGSVPTAAGPPAVRPIELPPLLAKLDVEAVADANIPLPSVRPPVTDRQVRTLLSDELIARAYLGTDPASASAEDFRRARDRFGRPLGVPQVMPDGAMRQPFERAVLELPADGGPARPAALGRLAVRLGLVPKQAMRLEPVPGLPVPPAETRLDPAPLLRLIGVGLVLLAVTAVAGAVVARRSRTGGAR
jgi:hypothetical protein